VAPVPYSPLIGRNGPRAIDHVRCHACGTQYNGETGREITSTVGRHLYPALLAVILSVLFFLLTIVWDFLS